MPLQILNAELYADRTVQDWHRREMPRDADAIDLDLFGVCHRAYCRDPLYFIEATTNPNKPATILRRLAEKSKAYAFIVQHDTERLTGIRVVHHPEGMKSSEIVAQDFSEALKAILTYVRDEHEMKAHSS